MNRQTAIMTLGRLTPDRRRLSESLEGLDGVIAPSRLHELLSRSKVTRLALAALEGDDSSPWRKELRALLAAEVHEDDAWQHRALPKMREVVEATAPLGGRIIKGLCVQPLYPDPGLRHLGDVDLQYPDWASARPMTDWLRRQGWVYDTQEYPWLKWHDSGHIYGQLSLVYPDNTAPYARVDLHIGAFSVGHAGLLPLTGWREGTALGRPATVPSTETSIAITAAHALCDQLLSVKDLNDLHVLIADTVPDWTSVMESCQAVQAHGALNRLLDVLRVVYPDDAVALPARLHSRTRLDLDPPTPRRRSTAFASLAYRDGRARGADVLAAARLAGSAQRYFSADLKPRSETGAGNVPGPRERRRDLCWRLVPREVWEDLPAAPLARAGRSREPLGADLMLITCGDAAAVRCGDDIVIPTVWGGIAPQSVALARDIAENET